MDISVIILSYNTKEITLRCLQELDQICKTSTNLKVQVIVVDNASTDGSTEMLRTHNAKNYSYEVVYNTDNSGFSKGNNIGLRRAKGRYILYLNSDVMTANSSKPIDLSELLTYMDLHTEIGALTVRVEQSSGKLDPASHRGFPTPWRSMTYFMKLEKLAQVLHITHKDILKVVGGYHLLDKDLNTIHQIDAGTAAFLLCQKELIDELKGFDEAFFMYGEDLDLCYRMKEKGYQIVWYPTYTVTHLKYQSGLGSADVATKKKIRWHFYDAMEKFYRKHLERKYCPCINMAILTIIRLRKFASK
jgi:GT2 family glycosyltransferase